ncbi:hypothetical protein [Cardinium endosymbiont of Philonthus spinipes]|uniref:hypothetical protein n=1 Tax=Cardinium endosymbiont of Philonthus spinipes TaxID=3077941 RepID=UPI00313BFB3C
MKKNSYLRLVLLSELLVFAFLTSCAHARKELRHNDPPQETLTLQVLEDRQVNEETETGVNLRDRFGQFGQYCTWSTVKSITKVIAVGIIAYGVWELATYVAISLNNSRAKATPRPSRCG